jgi:hypothetical protein
MSTRKDDLSAADSASLGGHFGDLGCGCIERIGTAAGACFGSHEHGAERTHRYALWRRWGNGPLMVALFLNPSTADENVADRTLTRTERFAQESGRGGALILNAFALRSPYPSALLADPRAAVGPQNDAHIRALVRREDVDAVMVGWGANMERPKLAFRVAELRTLLDGVPVLCWAYTREQPRHPLARGKTLIPYGTVPRMYRWPE